MKVNIIATGSSANLYELLDKDNNSMLIEAGLPRAFYMKHRIGSNPPEMVIVSHSHSDHAQYIGEYRAVIPFVYLAPEKAVSDNFKVMGFAARHGEEKSTVFIIKSLVENKFLFFGTDFQYDKETNEYPVLFEALQKLQVENYLIECNYNDYLFHLADNLQRVGCERHLSDNDLVAFIKRVNPHSPKIVTIHGSNRLSADTYTKQLISSRIPNATVAIGRGQKNGIKDILQM